MDEQIAAMLEQRQKLEGEFREAQGEVNAECERMLNSASIAPAKMLAQMSHGSGAVAAVGSVGTVGPVGLDSMDDSNGRLGLGNTATSANTGGIAGLKAPLR